MFRRENRQGGLMLESISSRVDRTGLQLQTWRQDKVLVSSDPDSINTVESGLNHCYLSLKKKNKEHITPPPKKNLNLNSKSLRLSNEFFQ